MYRTNQRVQVQILKLSKGYNYGLISEGNCYSLQSTGLDRQLSLISATSYFSLTLPSTFMLKTQLFIALGSWLQWCSVPLYVHGPISTSIVLSVFIKIKGPALVKALGRLASPAMCLCRLPHFLPWDFSILMYSHIGTPNHCYCIVFVINDLFNWESIFRIPHSQNPSKRKLTYAFL